MHSIMTLHGGFSVRWLIMLNEHIGITPDIIYHRHTIHTITLMMIYGHIYNSYIIQDVQAEYTSFEKKEFEESERAERQ